MAHVAALERILSTSKELKISFSAVQDEHLGNMGIRKGHLYLNLSACPSYVKQAHLDRLCDEINRIYRYVSMVFQSEAGPKMILDAVLLTVADAVADNGEKLPVAILPEFRLTTTDGVLIRNPKTSSKTWLTGTVDYCLCTYECMDAQGGSYILSLCNTQL
ncbi:hypothetical protein PHLGIDRAFT_38067 [Phlebiopsis gigantea 11061_1 CR5-6]|uniref:Uncharacterized protein n=1 Tax=Phlebiopsis gigantea (strain 11061_1 CR5-6) TaxID=745531 RepID=A0A0C3S2U3_PHLG1|nr:hypothetical protein PHLGIDRAFT_38067 [Phlebiopsis gigantea 11061_1 CR5-6]